MKQSIETMKTLGMINKILADYASALDIDDCGVSDKMHNALVKAHKAMSKAMIEAGK